MSCEPFGLTDCWVLVLQNGTDYGFLARQNSELLRALDELDKTCSTLREENSLLVRPARLHPGTGGSTRARTGRLI